MIDNTKANEILSKIEDESSLDKLLPEYLDEAMKSYFIGGTVGTVASVASRFLAHIPLIFLFTGPIWNYVDSVGGFGTSVANIKKANDSLLNRTSKLSISSMNLIWSLAMPGLTGWAAYTTVESLIKTSSIKSLISTAGISLGASTALAASAFSFAAAMFLCASWSGYAWYRAQRKMDSVYLETDRQKRINKIEETIKKLEDIDSTKINDKIIVLKAKKENPFLQEKELNELNKKIGKLENQLTKINKNIESLKKKKDAFEIQKGALSKYNDNKSTSEERKFVKLLLLKQREKARKMKEDTIAWVAAGVGAVCVGLALLFPPAALGLGIAAATFYAVTSTIKATQLIDKRKAARARQMAYKKIISEQFTENIQEAIKDKKEKAELGNRVQQHLVDTYFKENEIPDHLKEALTQTDREFIVDLQCQKIYEKEKKATQQNSSWLQFFRKPKKQATTYSKPTVSNRFDEEPNPHAP